MRRILLWMAGNAWLRRHLPRLPFARRAVRRFMPGETIEEALDAAERFRPLGIGILLTHLGENLASLDQAGEVADHYHRVIDMVRARGLDAEVSLKLTQIGLDLDPDATHGHLAALASHAAEGGATLWIDMESSAYVDRSLQLYRRLKADHPNAGICLQAYLRRTPADVHALMPLRPAIRLVKGAYDEPERIAFRRREEVDAAYQSLSVLMLPHAASGAMRLGLGTHDTRLIERVGDHARGADIPVTAFEVQMLYGIRMDEQRRLAAEGYVVKDLIAYGEAWYAWYMRRLAERPANVLFALRQLFG
ncbi:MAG TPA: proline dehydrogenase family protein [Candidatus Limnocylindria bacterium]